jgi:DNA-binding transcriptional MocR family regulator
VQSVQCLYAGKIALAAKTMQEQLAGIVTFETPAAGMFMWGKLTGKKADGSDLEFNDYMPDMEKYKAVVLPGRLFRVGVPASVPCPYFRASVVGATDEDISEGFKRLGEALRAAGC